MTQEPLSNHGKSEGNTNEVHHIELQRVSTLQQNHGMRIEELEEKKVMESRSPSLTVSSSTHPDDSPPVNPNYDPEALSAVQSNSPPYSVFSKRQKHFIVFLAAFGGFFSPLSANIYFPALTTLKDDFNVSSTLMNLTLTSYMIFQGLAPTIFGDLADMASVSLSTKPNHH